MKEIQFKIFALLILCVGVGSAATTIPPGTESELEEPMLKQITDSRRPFWNAMGSYQEDNKNRIYETIDQSLELLHIGNTTLRVVHRYSEHREKDVPTVFENGLGGGLNKQFGLYHNLDLMATGNSFSDELDSTYAAYGRLNSKWTDNFRTDIRGERAPVYTARAMINQTTAAEGQLDAEVNFTELWQTRLVGIRSNFSDENRRTTGIFELARFISQRFGPCALIRLTADNMKNDSPDYYSPRHLTQYQAGLDWPVHFSRDFECRLAYVPGFGKESNANSQFVQSFLAELRKMWWGRLSVGLSGALDTTPSYRNGGVRGSVEFGF